MKIRGFFRCLVLGLAAYGLVLTAGAQEAGKVLRLRSAQITKQRTPVYTVQNGSETAKVRDWAVLDINYDTAPLWIDQLDFVCYLVVKKVDGESKQPLLLQGKVSYANIAKGAAHKASFYLHPSTVARYGDVIAKAVLVYKDGQPIAAAGDNVDKRWWESMTPVSGLVLNRLQTPFAMLNFDDYEAIKPDTSR